MTTKVNVNSPHRLEMEQKQSHSQHVPNKSYVNDEEELSITDSEDAYNQYSYDNLQKLHSRHMDNGTSFIAQSPELVDMLGGIDQILTDYLNSNNKMLLNEIQRQRIHQVISKPPLSDHKNERPKDYTYLFLIQSTSINLCLNKENAAKFVRFMFHKLTLLFFSILGVILLIFQIGIKNISDRTWFVYYQCIYYILTILWLIFVLLITNKSALCVVSKTFEFVLKFTLTLFAILMEYIWFFVVNKPEKNELIEKLVVYISWLALILMMIIFSSLDALYVKIWIKTYLGFVLSVILIIHTWNISLNDTLDILEIVGTSISLGSLAVSSLNFVLLFVIKQTVLSLLKKDKIISVKSSPYVKWVNDSEKESND